VKKAVEAEYRFNLPSNQYHNSLTILLDGSSEARYRFGWESAQNGFRLGNCCIVQVIFWSSDTKGFPRHL